MNPTRPAIKRINGNRKGEGTDKRVASNTPKESYPWHIAGSSMSWTLAGGNGRGYQGGSRRVQGGRRTTG